MCRNCLFHVTPRSCAPYFIVSVKCDLHVHTWHSGMFTMPVVGRFVRESYSQPDDVYAYLKQRGMNLVTITDHDSIDAVEPLRPHEDFFLSEEVTAVLPSGNEAHIGVYDITEKQHIQIQRRRDDFFSLCAYLSERRIFSSVNHMFSGLTGRREATDFEWFARSFPAFETRNGQLLPALNEKAARLARSLGKAAVGGSDAHAMRSAGGTWTEVPGARSKEEFLAGLRAGAGRVAGEEGSCAKLTRDVYAIIANFLTAEPVATLAAPLSVLVPIFILKNYVSERAFASRWGARLETNRRAPVLPLWGARASEGAPA